MALRQIQIGICVGLSLHAIAGCLTKEPTKEELIESQLRTMRMSLWSEQLRARHGGIDADSQYHLCWKRAAIQFLENQPVLDKPHLLAAGADLWPPSEGYQPGTLVVHFLEYETHVLGIILYNKGGSEERAWLMPVFAHDYWFPDTAPLRRRALVHEYHVPIACAATEEPGVRARYDPRGNSHTRLELQLPKQMARAKLSICLYDEKGQNSNAVDLQWAEERAPTTQQGGSQH